MLTRGLRSYAELTGNKRASIVTSEDVMISAAGMLSVFIREPEFVGQTKDRLATVEAIRIVENAVRDAFDHWLAGQSAGRPKLLDWVIARADERVRRRQEKEVRARRPCASCACPASSPTARRTPLPAPNFSSSRAISAGGSAKQARDRSMQAILPLRGKILNVASAGNDKMAPTSRSPT
jgi:topoisomerase-4 subunit B